MKSEKAKEYLFKNVLDYPYTGYITEQVAEMAVELAEQEAEERIREKTHKIVKEMMDGVFNGDMPQKIADEFIQKLNEV